RLAFSFPGQIMRGVNMLARILPAVALLLPSAWIHADEPPPIKVLAVISKAKDHQKMMAAAGPMLEELGRENHFSVDVTDDGSVMTDANLAKYQVFVQLQHAPFDMKAEEQAALQRFIESGHGWVGIHAAGLTGREFIGAGAPYWQWFEDFFGGVIYSPHPRF